jgi:multicomponent Na+:H+ antiporter subunit C
MIEHVEAAFQRPNFIAFVVLFLWGLFIMVAHPNMVKKLIGMYIVQTSIIFLLVTMSAKTGATVPVLRDIDTIPSATAQVDSANYANPLPHVLTLTAIVVQIATLGVSLGLVTAIYRKYGSLDEDDVLKRME